GPFAELGQERNGLFFPAGSSDRPAGNLKEGGAQLLAPSPPDFGGKVLAPPGTGDSADDKASVLLVSPGTATHPAQGGQTQDQAPPRGGEVSRFAGDAVFASWGSEEDSTGLLGHGPARSRWGRG